ncbi:MAG: hypothetical protein WCL30_03955 [Pseudomonadota bacterium]
MPQLDPASFASQLIWLSIFFVALYAMLNYLLLPRVQSVLSMRTRTIADDIGEAEQMKSEAERAKEFYEKSLADARSQSNSLLLQAQSEISTRSLERIAALDLEIENKIIASTNEISAAKAEIMKKVAPVAGELTGIISEIMISHKPDNNQIDQIIHNIAR